MKRITCMIDILPISAQIVPLPGTGTSITEPGPPDVNMTFWKTAYGEGVTKIFDNDFQKSGTYSLNLLFSPKTETLFFPQIPISTKN